MATQQKSFSSNLGAIMAAVGSAVGLGNIWRFPYTCGKYGGGAFLLVYLCFVFLLGSVLMMSEFVIGRRSQHTPIKAFGTLRPDRKGWMLVGVLGVVTSFFILSQYLVLSGWTTGYVWDAARGALGSLGTDAAAISDYFKAFSTDAWRPALFLGVFSLLVLAVILGGVQKGIENVSKVLMPVLVLLILVLCVKSLTLPGAGKGVEYLFSADFSKLTGEGVLAALGQALFSLSVGMGVMIVYGSYIPLSDNIFKTGGSGHFPGCVQLRIRPGRWSRTGVLCAAQCVQLDGRCGDRVCSAVLCAADGGGADECHFAAGGVDGYILRAYACQPHGGCFVVLRVDHCVGTGVLAVDGQPVACDGEQPDAVRLC